MEGLNLANWGEGVMGEWFAVVSRICDIHPHPRAAPPLPGFVWVGGMTNFGGNDTSNPAELEGFEGVAVRGDQGDQTNEATVLFLEG